VRDQKRAEEIASQRVQLLSPLLAEDLDAAQARQIKASICQQTGISERTLRRYLSQYRKNGFGGLKPKGKGQRISEDAIPINLLEQAILLRRQVPGRSIAQIIQILEWEGLAQPGQIKRSTLQEKLAQRGYSTRHMRMYAETGIAARRFQKKYRNQLWYSDIKYGPYLPIGKDGGKKQVYLGFLPNCMERGCRPCLKHSTGCPELRFHVISRRTSCTNHIYRKRYWAAWNTLQSVSCLPWSRVTAVPARPRPYVGSKIPLIQQNSW